jgi:hypothetical protein
MTLCAHVCCAALCAWLQGPLTEEVVRRHTAVVWCNGARDELARWDEVCRAHKIAFIAVGTLGATGYVFSDFGPRCIALANFVVFEVLPLCVWQLSVMLAVLRVVAG